MYPAAGRGLGQAGRQSDRTAVVHVDLPAQNVPDERGVGLLGRHVAAQVQAAVGDRAAVERRQNQQRNRIRDLDRREIDEQSQRLLGQALEDGGPQDPRALQVQLSGDRYLADTGVEIIGRCHVQHVPLTYLARPGFTRQVHRHSTPLSRPRPWEPCR